MSDNDEVPCLLSDTAARSLVSLSDPLEHDSRSTTLPQFLIFLSLHQIEKAPRFVTARSILPTHR